MSDYLNAVLEKGQREANAERRFWERVMFRDGANLPQSEEDAERLAALAELGDHD